jgi:DNA-binding transcriptional LysR family regulator
VHLESFLSRNGIEFPDNVVEVNSFLMMTTLMQEMPLLNLAPTGFAQQLVDQNLASILPLAVDGAYDIVYLAWHALMPLPTAARLFRDFVLRMVETGVDALPSTILPLGRQ